MKKLLSATLVALAAFGFVDADARGYRHEAKCKIHMVEVTDEPRLIIDGVGLMKWNNVPNVFFGGIELEVDPGSTSKHIEAFLRAEDLADVPKDYLLEIKRSRWDYGCPRHLVTAVPQSAQVVECPNTCADGIVLWEASGSSGTGLSVGVCSYDEVRMAGGVDFTHNAFTAKSSVLKLVEGKCDIDIGGEEHLRSTLTDEQQAACAPLAKAAVVSLIPSQQILCRITPKS